MFGLKMYTLPIYELVKLTQNLVIKAKSYKRFLMQFANNLAFKNDYL